LPDPLADPLAEPVADLLADPLAELLAELLADPAIAPAILPAGDDAGIPLPMSLLERYSMAQVTIAVTCWLEYPKSLIQAVASNRFS
jgi:hypothetical protein